MRPPTPLHSLTADHAAGRLPLFTPAPPLIIRSAPARLDVLGALGASAGGTLAQIALPLEAAVALQPSIAPMLFFHSEQIQLPLGLPSFELPLPAIHLDGKLRPFAHLMPDLVSPSHWAARLVALYYALEETRGSNPSLNTPAQGLSILIRSNIPMGAGMASSTALLSAFLLALSDLRSARLDLLAQARLLDRAESLVAEVGGTSEGPLQLIDAMTCLESAQNPLQSSLLRFSAQPHRLVGSVKLPPEVRILALDTGVHASTSPETLAELRIAGAMGFRIIETIYKDLGQRHIPLHGYLANTSPLLYRQYFRALLPKRLRGSDFLRTYLPPTPPLPGQEPIDPATIYRVRTAVDHLIAENEHAEQFLQAMEELSDPLAESMDLAERQRTLHRAGRLLLASHHSYRLRLELSCRQADWIVDHLMEFGGERGVYGGRITGGGGGGTVVALVENTPPATDALLKLVTAYKQTTGLPLTVTLAGTCH